jgi:hypothetical protein
MAGGRRRAGEGGGSDLPPGDQKAAQEIEAPASGRVIRKAESGNVYPVGAEIGEIA